VAEFVEGEVSFDIDFLLCWKHLKYTTNNSECLPMPNRKCSQGPFFQTHSSKPELHLDEELRDTGRKLNFLTHTPSKREGN
jgi:hypothetical protein